MGNFESYIDIIEMVADAVNGNEKAMRDTIEHLTGERPGDDARLSDLRVASTFAILGWSLAIKVDGAALEVVLTVGDEMRFVEAGQPFTWGDPGVYLVREPFIRGDEMRFVEAGQPRRIYGGMAVTTILDFFREVVGPEDDDAPDL